MQIIQDLITQGVDGLAISVSDAEAAVGVIKQARDAGIAVITFDADSPKSARQAYVGTNNKEMGAELGRQLIKLHPQPGIYITQSGGPAAENLNERLAGLNGVLQEAGWKQAPGSPSYCNDDFGPRQPATIRHVRGKSQRRRDRSRWRVGVVRTGGLSRASSTHTARNTTATSLPL